MVIFDRPLIRSDGIAYLAWVDTITLDQDIDLTNQVEKLQPVLTYQILWNENTGRWAIVFPFGVAFLQAPFYLIGHWFAGNGWFNTNPDYFYQMQGVSLPYSLWLMIGANLMGLGAMLFAYFAGRRLCGDIWAATAAYAVFLGTPLFYYSTISPLNSHNPGAFAAAGFIYLLVSLTDPFKKVMRAGLRPAPTESNPGEKRATFALPLMEFDFQDRYQVGAPAGAPLQKLLPNLLFKFHQDGFLWLLMGIFAGLTILSRWQLALVIAPGYLLLIWERRWRGFTIAGIGAIITLLPLPIIFQWMFGSPFTIPYNAVEGEAFLQESSNHAWDVLVQTIIHSPIILLSFVSLFFLWRINRKWALMTATMIVLQIIVNGAALDWWAGESYGMRRMSELYPVYVVLICAVLSADGFQIRPYDGIKFFRWWPRIARGLVIFLIGYTFLYIFAFLDYTWTNSQGWFLAGPEVMIPYFINQPGRIHIVLDVMRAHVGPWAWTMPGP